MKNIIVAGATGLVGMQLVDALADEKSVETHIVVRRMPQRVPAGVNVHVADPVGWPEAIADIAAEVAISCLGTTMRAAGSREKFRAVDFDLVLAVANAAKMSGAKQMIAISSVGASAKSNNFYLKTKGEAEAAMAALGFARTNFLRPGLLTGGERPDRRPGESVGILLSPLTDLLLMGGLSRYRSIPSALVAQAIARLALGGGSGRHIHENDAIRALAG